MADMEKRLLAASPLKPFVWKRFIFSLWKIPMEEVSIFLNFADSFYPTINFTCEMSSESAVFLDTDVFPKDFAFQLLEFSIHKPISSPLKLFSTLTSYPVNHSLRKRVLSKEKHYFYKYKRDFKQRLCNRGYPTIPLS